MKLDIQTNGTYRNVLRATTVEISGSIMDTAESELENLQAITPVLRGLVRSARAEERTELQELSEVLEAVETELFHRSLSLAHSVLKSVRANPSTDGDLSRALDGALGYTEQALWELKKLEGRR